MSVYFFLANPTTKQVVMNVLSQKEKLETFPAYKTRQFKHLGKKGKLEILAAQIIAKLEALEKRESK